MSARVRSFPSGIASLGIALLGAALAAAPAGAQATGSIANRVAAAPDGDVVLGYASRSGACGDGGDVVAFGDALTVYPSMESYGHWSGVKCVPGPARVTLTVRAHRVEGIRTRIGATSSAVTGLDLGTVPAADAAAYFLSLARTLDGRDSRNAVLPAAIADAGPIAPALLGLATDAGVAATTRRRAAQWAGMLGDASIVPALERLTADSASSVAEAATYALSRVPDGAGMPALTRLARSAPNERAREKAVFWLGQTERPEALAVVREVAEDRAAPERVRGMAIFALGQVRDADQTPYLRALFPKLESDALREKVLQAAAERRADAGGRWLLDVARDPSNGDHVRRQAVFWAGQGGASTRDIAALYDALGTGSPAVREHTIFALSQRDDDAATTKLMDIARSDASPAMRKKALFWLGQKDDPRVTKFIADLVTRE